MRDKTPADPPHIADLKRRLAEQPASRVFIDLARECFEAGQLEAAADVCVKGLKRHPTYLSARVLLGRIYFDMGRTEEARDTMETVLAQAPDNLVARRVLADICLEQSDVEGALERFRVLLAFNPADADVRRKIDELEAKVSGAATRPPAPAAEPPAHVERPAAPVTAPAGPAQQPAAEAGGNGGGAGPLDAGVLATPTLAEIYLQQGLTDKAAEVYREILKGDPANAEALARLAEMEPRAATPLDPAVLARRRKIAALSSWLEVIRGSARAGGPRV